MRLLMGRGFTYNTEGRCELHQHADPLPVIEWRVIGSESLLPDASYCRFCSLNLAKTLWPLNDVNEVMAKWNAATSLQKSARTMSDLTRSLRDQLLGGVA